MIQLHVHSDGSVLDGSCKIERMLDEVERQNEKAVAITDHGSCIKLYEFYKKAKEKNIKPILGCEFYSGEEEDHNKFHIVLLVKNEVGLKNLFNLMYKSHKNFYSKPRIKYEDIEKHSEGLICLSACIGGELSKTYLKEGKQKALKVANYFRAIFKDDYYIEIQPNPLPFQKKFNEFAKELCSVGFKPVVTCDAHYVTKDEYNSHDTMLCIQVQKKKQDTDRFRFTSNDYYFKENEQILRELDYLGTSFVDEAIDNTYFIADKCNLVIDESKNLLPKMPEVEDERKKLAILCNEGFRKRHKQGHYKDIPIQKVIDRISYELENIISKGYAGYFLIVEDFVRYCKENNIPYGVGRGSVCGSEVAFILGITEVEPIKYGLLYERFLNPTRNSPPDIDTDVCYEMRGIVLDYIKGKYGEDNVSHIITEGKMTTKAVIRKVLTAYGYEMKVINQTCKLVDERCENLEEAIQNEDLARRLVGKPEYEDMKKLEGLMSHAGKHAAGLLITPEPVYNLFPTRIDREENVLVCEWHKKHIEKIGAYKFDLLGLKQLTIFNKTIQAINRNYNKSMTLDDLFNIDYEDEKIYEVLNKGALKTVFQFTGGSASAVIDQMKPKNFNDIMVAESICRPGVKEANLYLSNRKLFNESGTFPVPTYYEKVRHLLDETYGAIVYQEQTMNLLHEIGGFTLGEADSLRKVKSLEEYRERFINGALTKGFTVEEANELFDRFDLGYSFNKSHACAYGKTSAMCCYLLANYPKEFIASSMTLELTQAKPDIKGFIREAVQLGINILPPNINTSTDEFYADLDGIRLPLNMIANVGDSAYASILSKRPYTSFSDFVARVPKRSVKKNSVVNLIKAGCFDEYNKNRSLVLSDYYNSRNEEENVYYWCDDVQMVYETEAFGFTLGKHQLDGYVNKDINEFNEDDNAVLNCLVTEVRLHKDKHKKDMLFLKLENKVCDFEGILFSYGYAKLSKVFYVGAKVCVQGKKQGKTILVNNAFNI